MNILEQLPGLVQAREIKLIFPLSAMFLLLNSAFGQQVTINGSSSAPHNSYRSYYVGGINDPIEYFEWNVYYGQVISQAETDVYIRWTTSGTQQIHYDAYTYYDDYYGSKNVTVTGGAPSTPGNPTISSPGSCTGQATLTRNGTPPSGVTWYWQGKVSNGTSTTKGSGSTFIANEGSGNYYIRARNGSGVWSTGSGVKYVTITNPAPAPSTANGSNGCGTSNIVLESVTTFPSGGGTTADHNWYTIASGGSPISPGNITVVYSDNNTLVTNYTVTSSGNYWVSTDMGSCESSRTQVTATLIPNVAPSVNASVVDSDLCDGSATFNLSVSGGAAGTTYQWYNVATGGSVLATGSTYNPTVAYGETTNGLKHFYVGGTVKDSRGCSYPISPRESISVLVYPLPGVPSVSGESVRTNTSFVANWVSAPNVDSYRIDVSSNNTFTQILGSYNDKVVPSGTNTTISGLEPGKYYYYRVRGYNDLCGLSANSAPETAYTTVAAPSVPSVSSNVCNDKTLTRGSSGYSHITWYWQGTNQTGMSTENSASSYPVTSSGTYYIRARSNDGIWSSSTGVAVTVNQIPSLPATPSISSNTCGDKTLTRATPPGGETWYWQGTNPNGMNTTNYSSTYTASSSGTYYIRSKSSADCWGPSRSIVVTVNQFPSMPALPTVSSNTCGDKTLTRATPPGGETWYWQGTNPNGMNTTNYSSTYTVSSSGTYYIRSKTSANCWGTSRSVAVTVNQIPAIPSTPTVSTNTCGNKTLTRGTPPADVTWYWQGTVQNGTSTTNSNSTYAASSTGTYYIRPRSSAGCWGTERSVAVTVNQIPAIPSTPTVSTNTCGDKTLTRGTPPADVTWYWQGTVQNGTSDTNSNSTYAASSTGTYYIRPRSSAGCWGTERSVAVTVNQIPAIPSTPTVSTNTCGNKTLTRGTPPANVTWYWQGTVQNGTSDTNSNSTYAASSTGTYYIRPRSSAGCWGTERSVAVTVNQIPAIPSTPTVSTNTCGDQTLTRGTPPADVTWYWQGTVQNGTSDTNSNSTYAASSTGTYYIRPRSSAGCWGTERSVAVTVNPNPVDTYTLSGGGTRCSNEPGFTLTLSGSQNSVSYQLKRDGNDVGAAVPGNAGNPINWANQTLTGSYYVVATYPSTSCSSTMPGNPSIIVNTASTVDAGPALTTFFTSSFTLTGGTPAGGSWSGPGVFGSTFNATTAGLGNHTITYSYTNGSNCSNSDTRVVTVDANPPVQLSGPATIYTGQSVTLSVPAGYSAYQWKRNAQNITGANSHTYIATQSGDYQVEITANSGATYLTASARVAKEYGSLDQNHIRTITFKKAGIDPDDFPEDVDAIRMNIDYIDGLGRPMQQVMWNASPDMNDVVQPILYDAYGRAPVDFLPFAHGNTGEYQSTAADLDPVQHQSTLQYGFYQNASKVAHDSKPYSVKIFEASPLNRILKQGAPGVAWQPHTDPLVTSDHVVRFAYGTNSGDSSDEVKMWDVVNDLPVSSGNYGAGQLQKIITEDEEGNDVVEYTDKLGRTVLRKAETGDGTDLWAQTYYIYDDFGDLRFVLPPKIFAAGTSLESGELDALGFQYKYDERRRMAQKKVPGAGWVYMVYDNRDRLVMTQDANQRAGGKKDWAFTKYDHLNRPVLTGIYTHGTLLNQGQMQGVVNLYYDGAPATKWYESRGTTVHGYTNRSYPDGASSEAQYLTVTYYDDYTWNSDTDYNYNNPSLSHSFNGVVYLSETSHHMGTKGLITGSKIKNLSNGIWLKSVTYYDDRYRVSQVVGDNNLGQRDVTSNLYDFIGKVLKTKTVHDDGTQTTSVTRTFDYDHADRLLTVKHQVNTGTEIVLLENEYNELGELVDKKLHSTNGTDWKQSLDYRYNIRGWLTSMNNAALAADAINDDADDFFGFQLAYNEAVSGVGNTLAYNGNISAMMWSDLNQAGGVKERAYSYGYDPMNRLSSAQHHTKTTGSFGSVNSYSVSGLDYDLNGNILALTRKGVGSSTIDALVYNYEENERSNRLLKVEDGVSSNLGFKNGITTDNEYLYDANGNMVKDLNKGIDSIYYNHLNLPYLVDMESPGDSIEYSYDASGIKLRQKVFEGGNLLKTTDYVGEFIYEAQGTGPKDLQFIRHEEGRIVKESEMVYQYHLKDHLGNVRTTFTTKSYLSGYLATMEDATYTQDTTHFFNIDPRVPYPAPVGGKAARLNSSWPIGPGFYTPVSKGDTIDMSAKAYYEDANGWGTNSAPLATLAVALTTAYGGLNGGNEGQQLIYDVFNSFAGGALAIGGTGNDSHPAAYLNYLVFDTDYNLTGQTGYVGMPQGANLEWMLSAQDLIIAQAGHVYIYVSYESTSSQQVYFDNFDIAISESPILESSDYYPFGLTFNSYTKPGTTEQRYKYNGMEEQPETGWLQPAEFRMYDPALGRFMMIDPVIKFHESPYAWNTNNPISFADPLGSDSTQRADALAKAQEYVNENTTKATYKEGAKGDPGENVDCSGLTSACAVAGGENDPITMSDNGGGVKRTHISLPSVDEANVVPGNFVILDNSKSGKDNPTGHIGIITVVERDENGNITTLKMIDSGGSEGPRNTTLIDSGTKKYYGNRITAFKKFDSIPDGPLQGSSLSPVKITAPRLPTLQPIGIGGLLK